MEIVKTKTYWVEVYFPAESGKGFIMSVIYAKNAEAAYSILLKQKGYAEGERVDVDSLIVLEDGVNGVTIKHNKQKDRFELLFDDEVQTFIDREGIFDKRDNFEENLAPRGSSKYYETQTN